jgi:hypothetical protein
LGAFVRSCGGGSKRPLTKLEQAELRDVRSRLRALLGRGTAPGAAGAVTIGLATLQQLRAQSEQEDEDGSGDWRRESSSAACGRRAVKEDSPAESLAAALAALTWPESLVHEVLWTAGMTFDELLPPHP